jgi:hypothetical protein
VCRNLVTFHSSVCAPRPPGPDSRANAVVINRGQRAARRPACIKLTPPPPPPIPPVPIIATTSIRIRLQSIKSQVRCARFALRMATLASHSVPLLLLVLVASFQYASALDFKRVSCMRAALCIRCLPSQARQVHLVDRASQPTSGRPNFLFRGNMPTNSTSFDLDGLLAFMSNRSIEEGGIDLPKDTKLIVISLNNVFDESKPDSDFRKETDFWKNPENAKYGSFVNWPLGLAGIAPPTAFPEVTWKTMLKALVWDIDLLPKRIGLIRSMLTADYNSSVAIYVHCTAGCDRTGEIMGAYAPPLPSLTFQPYFSIDLMARTGTCCSKPL